MVEVEDEVASHHGERWEDHTSLDGTGAREDTMLIRQQTTTGKGIQRTAGVLTFLQESHNWKVHALTLKMLPKEDRRSQRLTGQT